MVGEVEEDFEVGLGGAGKAGVDEECGVGVELLCGIVVMHEGEAPGGADEDVAGVERCFVDCGELSRSRAELVEEGFAFGKGGGEVGGADGLSAGWAGEEEGFGEMGDDGGQIVFGGFAGVKGEETGHGSFGCEHGDLLEICAGACRSDCPAVNRREGRTEEFRAERHFSIISNLST